MGSLLNRTKMKCKEMISKIISANNVNSSTSFGVMDFTGEW